MVVAGRILGLAIVLVVGAVGCKKEVHVGVECATVEDGVKCTVTHQSGEVAAKACWDFVVHCTTGEQLKVSSCAAVQPKQSVEQHLPISPEDIARCGEAASAEATNLVLSEVD